MNGVELWILTAVVVLSAVLGVLAARRSASAVAALGDDLRDLRGRVEGVDAGQHRLAGGLTQINEAQSSAQTQTLRAVETRLAEVSAQMGDSLAGAATRTAHALGDLQQRLAAIDKAQETIQRLSGDVLGLQEILSNKQARGAFGEIQLNDIVSKAFAPDAYQFQVTLSNNKRADCVLTFPHPPGMICIDSKFPLEHYARLIEAEGERAKTDAARGFRQSVVQHIKDIEARYILPGETADSAMLFLPSEAIYAEIHGKFPEVVRESFERKVWIVSPSTLMATLTTLRAVAKDIRLAQNADGIRRELSLLIKDVSRLAERAEKLGVTLGRTEKELRDIGVSADKALKRAQRLEALEFEAEERLL